MLLTADNPRVLPSSDSKSGKDPGDFHFSPQLDEDIDIFGERMSGTSPASPAVKNEPEDWADFGMAANQDMNVPGSGQQRFGHMPSGSINPSELSTQSGGSFGMSNFGGQPGSVAGSFPMGHAGMGSSGIADDELLDLDLNENRIPHQINTNPNASRPEDFDQLFATQAMQQPQPHGQQPMPQQQMYTNTPSGEPIQSPFLRGGYNYQAYPQHMAQHMSPHVRPGTAGSHIMTPDMAYASAGRPRQAMAHMMDRQPSDSRSPMTPKTPGQNGFDLSGTPDSGSGAGMSLPHRHHHPAGMPAGAWDSNPASLHSLHSPMVSPATHPGHSPFSEVLHRGVKHGSPSTHKMEHPVSASAGGVPGGVAAYQSQEAKRRRRRESHNMVERRRRDNINERIQELAHLVPHHRLEDEKLRKHLATNGPSGPLSPTLTGIGGPVSATSPTGAGAAATSLLAANGGRRATGAGTITLGLPPDDKDKGPNKGDILNGSVGWTRDLMWALQRAWQREARLRADMAAQGRAWPFDEPDDERRMRSELADAVRHGVSMGESFAYSRGQGTGLRVPGHTNLAGDALPAGQQGGQGGQGGQSAREGVAPEGQVSPQSLSPAGQPRPASGSSESPAGFWGGGFKEEDEYEMQLN